MKERRLKHSGFNFSFCFDSEDQCVPAQGRFPCVIAKILKHLSIGILVSNGFLTSRREGRMFAKDSEELKVMMLAITGVMKARYVY